MIEGKRGGDKVTGSIPHAGLGYFANLILPGEGQNNVVSALEAMAMCAA